MVFYAFPLSLSIALYLRYRFSKQKNKERKLYTGKIDFIIIQITTSTTNKKQR